MISINRRQARALLADLEELEELEDDTLVQLQQVDGATVELTIDSLDRGDFLFADGTTGY